MASFITDMVNKLRSCEGYTGNPSLFNRCHWVETSSKTWTYCPKIKTNGKDLPVGLVFPAVIDPVIKNVNNIGSWRPKYSWDPEKAKWTARFNSPTDPQLAMLYAANMEFFKKVQKAIDENSPGKVNYAADDSFVKGSAPMFEKRTPGLSKFESNELIKMPVGAIEANWELDSEYQDAWNKTMMKARLLPMVVWKETMTDMAYPNEYAELFPGALVEVHLALTFHGWGNEGNFAAKIEQLVLWRHGSPSQESVSAYANLPIMRGPIRKAAKRSIEELGQAEKTDKVKQSSSSTKSGSTSHKAVPKASTKVDRPIKKIPTKSSRSKQRESTPEEEVHTAEDVIADEDNAPGTDGDVVEYEEGEIDQEGGSGGSESWSGISSRESSLTYTEDEADADAVDPADMDGSIDEEHADDVKGDAIADGVNDNDEPAFADEDDAEEIPAEEHFHPPMSPAKRQKRTSRAPHTPKKKGNTSVPTTPISRLRLSSNSPKETSPVKRSVTRSATTAAKSAAVRKLPARTARKSGSKA